MPRHSAENGVGRGIGSVAAVPRSPAAVYVDSGEGEDSIREAGLHKQLVVDSASVVVLHTPLEDKRLVAGRFVVGDVDRSWAVEDCSLEGVVLRTLVAGTLLVGSRKRVLAGRHWVGVAEL